MAEYYRGDDKPVVIEREGSGSGVASNLIWAITTLAVVGILVWAIFYSGFFKLDGGTKKIGVDVNVSAPANR